MATAATTAPTNVSSETRSRAVKLRRGLTMLAMSLVVPGSAQVAAGNRRLGRLGLRVWLTLVGLALLAVVLAFAARTVLVTLLTTGWVLWLGSFVVLALGLFWAFLVADTWWAARPAAMGAVRGAAFSAVSALLVGALVFGSWTVSAAMRSSGNLVSSVFAGGGDSRANAGRINVLLIGGDADQGREGLRADTVMVASVHATTGRTVLFGLPRNLEDVPFPDSSPLKKLYPKGYGCPTHECLLNAVYGLGVEHKDLYPGVKLPGVQATKEAVEEILGLKINYYAMVDLWGFVELVDAVGGIRVDVNKRVPIGGGGSKVYGYIEPGKNQQLDGYHALWFARSRFGSTDYERMQRQKCVMSAMLNQLDPLTVATKFGQLAGATGQILVTDVPSSQINGLADLALKAKRLDTASVSFTPPADRARHPELPADPADGHRRDRSLRGARQAWGHDPCRPRARADQPGPVGRHREVVVEGPHQGRDVKDHDGGAGRAGSLDRSRHRRPRRGLRGSLTSAAPLNPCGAGALHGRYRLRAPGGRPPLVWSGSLCDRPARCRHLRRTHDESRVAGRQRGHAGSQRGASPAGRGRRRAGPGLSR